MGEKRKVTVDGEEFEVDLERDGDVWNVEVGGVSQYESRESRFQVLLDDLPVVEAGRSVPGSYPRQYPEKSSRWTSQWVTRSKRAMY